MWLLVHDHNGNHVIQRSITKINEFVAQATTVGLEREGGEEQNEVMTTSLVNALDIIIDEVTSSIKELATHPYGCRVVQRLIEHCHDAQKDKVLDCIFDADLSSSLINHEYGNYVIQRFLTYGRLSGKCLLNFASRSAACGSHLVICLIHSSLLSMTDKAAVFETITKNNNILKLSKQKHSSNVVEMMLTYGDVEQRHQIIDGILNVSLLLVLLILAIPLHTLETDLAGCVHFVSSVSALIKCTKARMLLSPWPRMLTPIMC